MTDQLCVFTTGADVTLLSRSCERVGIDLHTYETPWTDYVTVKLRRGISFLEDIDYEFVMWVDGHDTLVLKPEKEILDRWSQSNHSVVIAGERTCWPDAALAMRYPRPFGPLFINAGGFIGPRGLVIDTMQKVLEGADDGDDQRAWTKAYISGVIPQVGIDHTQRIFCSVADGKLDVDSCVKHWNGRVPGREEYWQELINE